MFPNLLIFSTLWRHIIKYLAHSASETEECNAIIMLLRI